MQTGITLFRASFWTSTKTTPHDFSSWSLAPVLWMCTVRVMQAEKKADTLCARKKSKVAISRAPIGSMLAKYSREAGFEKRPYSFGSMCMATGMGSSPFPCGG